MNMEVMLEIIKLKEEIIKNHESKLEMCERFLKEKGEALKMVIDEKDRTNNALHMVINELKKIFADFEESVRRLSRLNSTGNNYLHLRI
jgi:predicted KAP-like P-loop ATPase